MTYHYDIYADGGCVSKNPSTIAGTWACCFVNNDNIVESDFGDCAFSGYLTPNDILLPTVSNNVMEVYAILKALENSHRDWYGTIYSDSNIALNRFFSGWKWNGVPDWMISRYEFVKSRMQNFSKINFVLLQGHPTKKELETGIGNSGRPVSKWNVWCDETCARIAKEILKRNDQM